MASSRYFSIPASLRSLLAASCRANAPIYSHISPVSRQFSTTTAFSSASDVLPRVLQPSLWHTMIPKRFRRSADTNASIDASRKPRRGNPATPFIILSVLIGSQAIHTLMLRNEMVAFSRKAEAKVALLREVVERIQRGEDVPVEKILGTGDPEQEREWAEVIKEIEASDSLWRKQKIPKNSDPVLDDAPLGTKVVAEQESSVDHDIKRRGNISRGFH